MLQQLLLRAEGDCSQQDKPQVQAVAVRTAKALKWEGTSPKQRPRLWISSWRNRAREFFHAPYPTQSSVLEGTQAPLLAPCLRTYIAPPVCVFQKKEKRQVTLHPIWLSSFLQLLTKFSRSFRASCISCLALQSSWY